MTYRDFIEKHGVEEINSFLLREIGILKDDIKFINVDISPDYDKSEYRKGESKNYYFKNVWDFKLDYNSILDIEILKFSALDFFGLDDLKEDCKINVSRNDYSNETDYYCAVIDKAFSVDKYSLSEFTQDNWDEFQLNDFKIINTDNETKTITYDGSFFGEVNHIEMSSIYTFAMLKITNYKKDLNEHSFYKQLIAESTILLNEDKYKLAYFLIYSALESYINSQSQLVNKVERFGSKLKDFCSLKLDGKLNANQIYSSIIPDFKEYTIKRNSIAHGKGEMPIDKNDCLKIFNFVLLIIKITTTKESTFEYLNDRITNANII